MSVYKKKGEATYSYDFQYKGRRFSGNTQCKNKRDADFFEKAEREKAKETVKAEEKAETSPINIEIACSRYWNEVGQYHAAPKTTAKNLQRLIDFFGKGKLLQEITGDDVAKLVGDRRRDTVKGRKSIRDPRDSKKKIAAPLISPATVNRSTIEPLQKIFNRATDVWKKFLPNEPAWKDHLLPEARERVREVRAGEERKLDAVRQDYRPLLDFARASGLRQAECLMKKDDVDLIDGRVNVRGKGGKLISQPITTEMRKILIAEMANPTEWVFTYVAKRAVLGKNGYAKGARIPITKSGLKTTWRRSKHKKKGESLPSDLKFHDLRHDFATKLLRETKNIKLVSRALNHSKIETTAKYAHVLDEEVLAGMEAASEQRKKAKRGTS